MANVSVVVPVYNAARYLDECLASCTKQSYGDYEIILVDDGSADESLQICRGYAGQNKNVKVIHQQNRGVSAARNAGIRAAAGSYIVFVDADDRIAPDYIEKLVAPMQPKGMVACLVEQRLGGPRAERETLGKAAAQLSVFSAFGIKGYPFCKVFDADILRENRVFFDEDIAICEDTLFVTKYLYYARGDVIVLPPCGYYYRQHSASALHGRFDKRVPPKKPPTEYEAFCRAKEYLVEDKAVHRAWELCSARAAATCLRAMLAAGEGKTAVYKTLLAQVRRQAFPFCRSPVGALSSKVSMLLSALSPRLEFWVWRKSNEG